MQADSNGDEVILTGNFLRAVGTSRWSYSEDDTVRVWHAVGDKWL